MDQNYKYKYEKYKSKYLNIKYNLIGGSLFNIPNNEYQISNLLDGSLVEQSKMIESIDKNNSLAIIKLRENVNPEPDIIPVIEFYEYIIENYTYANEKNKFYGFISSNGCATISTERNINIKNNNISSCDVLMNSSDNKINLNFTPLNENYLEQFYKHLYNSYKLFSSRTNLADITSKNDAFCHLYVDKILNVAKRIGEKYIYLTQDINNFIYLRDHSFVQIVNLDPKEKVIVLGDIHGSLHTFVRILFRLHRYNVINLETFMVNKGFRIVFLGDVVDRGNFSLEIVFTIMLLIHNNNDDVNNPQVIYNRGNHEELSINSSQGFLNELNSRCNQQNGETLHYTINNLFKMFPSAIILNIMSEEKGYKFWLAHGGFPMNYINNKINTSKNIINLTAKDGKQTRWADFYQYKNDSSKHLVPNISRGVNSNNYKTDVLILNRKHLSTFLDTNNINFIIRGHQDNYYNSYLFTNMCKNINVCGMGISVPEHLNNGILVHNNQIELVKSSVGSKVKTNGPIARFVIDKNLFNKKNDNGEMYYYKEINGYEIYPVITLSTNTDRDRNLLSDSFAVMRFDLNLDNIIDFRSSIFETLSDLPKNLFI